MVLTVEVFFVTVGVVNDDVGTGVVVGNGAVPKHSNCPTVKKDL